MPTDKQIILAVKILEFLYENYSRGLTLTEMNDLLNSVSVKTDTRELYEVFSGLVAENFVEERSKANSPESNSNVKIIYHITSFGIERHNLLKQGTKRTQEARAYRDSEEEKIKKSNRRWLIGCAIGFVAVLVIVIIVALSLG